MKSEELFQLWEEGNAELFKDDKTSKDMITQYLKTQTIKSSRSFKFNILFYAVVQLVNIVLSSMNIVFYSSNILFQNILIGMLVFSVGILIYSISLFVKFREITNFSDTLKNLINKQLHFIKVEYEVWLFLVSASVLILVFNMNIMVDYDGGYYPINNKSLYVILNIGLFGFIYLTQKIANSFMLSSLKSYLKDLTSGSLDKSLIVEKHKKKYKVAYIIMALIFTITAVFGLLRFLEIV